MKTLLILRHAKSSWKHPGLPDHQRPLNKRGEKDAPRIGLLLYEESLVPDMILSSPAKRAAQTAQRVADACGFAGEIQYIDAFYPGWPGSYIEALQCLPENVNITLIIGHNPGIESFLEALTDEAETMPTAALAWLHLPIESWPDLTDETGGELLNFWRPRELPK